MSKYLKGISIENVVFENVMSAGRALTYVDRGMSNGCIIGREAKIKEISDKVKKIRYANGHTLVYTQKMGITEVDLESITIYTYLPENEIQYLTKFFKEIIHLQTLDDCLKNDAPVLIDWKDWRDEFEMFISMQGNDKTPEFRAPMLFYTDISDEIIEILSQKIKENL